MTENAKGKKGYLIIHPNPDGTQTVYFRQYVYEADGVTLKRGSRGHPLFTDHMVRAPILRVVLDSGEFNNDEDTGHLFLDYPGRAAFIEKKELKHVGG